MDQPVGPPLNFPPGPGPIPPVDPADLQAMWNLQDQAQARFPGQAVSLSATSAQRVMSPSADFGAVWFRVSILSALRELSKAGQPELAWLPAGEKPSQALFKAFATVPMTGIPHGKPTNKLPVDLDELAALIQNQPESE